MVWTRNRLPGLPDPATQERWAMIGKPIKPIPSEVKKLEAFIGRWDVENIFRPSASFPDGKTTKGTMNGNWILDGRFLFGDSDAGNVQSQWVIGYDTNKSAYRYVRFSRDLMAIQVWFVGLVAGAVFGGLCCFVPRVRASWLSAVGGLAVAGFVTTAIQAGLGWERFIGWTWAGTCLAAFVFVFLLAFFLVRRAET